MECSTGLACGVLRPKCLNVFRAKFSAFEIVCMKTTADSELQYAPVLLTMHNACPPSSVAGIDLSQVFISFRFSLSFARRSSPSYVSAYLL